MDTTDLVQSEDLYLFLKMSATRPESNNYVQCEREQLPLVQLGAFNLFKLIVLVLKPATFLFQSSVNALISTILNSMHATWPALNSRQTKLSTTSEAY